MIEIDYSKFPQEVQDLLKTAEFGIEVTRFMTSKVGQYLIGKAEQERTYALEEMAVHNATDIDGMRELQLIVRRSDSFAQWLADAQMDGDCAESIVQTGESE